MCRLTGAGLAAFAMERLGMPYFYGSKITHGVLTEEFMARMHRRFPDLVDEAYIRKAREKDQVGKVNVDCSGLIGAYRGKELSTAQLCATAYLRMPIGRIRDFAAGAVLWKQGHVGIYVGSPCGIPLCVEAKGIDHGTVLSRAEDTDWKAGLTFSDLRYDYRVRIDGTWRRENPCREPSLPVMGAETAESCRIRRAVTGGEGVRWLQWELREAGYELAVDGVFGEETRKCLIAYQTSCELEPDGIAGERTKAKMREAPL